jgi:hypothetical protein
MKNKAAILFIVLATLLLVVACAPKEAAKEQPVAGEQETATDTDVNSVESDISDIDAMTEETDTSDLDSLDQDLADIEALDIE